MITKFKRRDLGKIGTLTDDIVFELNHFGVNGLSLPDSKRKIIGVSAPNFDYVSLIFHVVLQMILFFKKNLQS